MYSKKGSEFLPSVLPLRPNIHSSNYFCRWIIYICPEQRVPTGNNNKNLKEGKMYVWSGVKNHSQIRKKTFAEEAEQ